MYIGNIGLSQGLENMLAPAKHRPDVSFLLFGDRADREKLERKAASEQLANLKFCGTIDSRGVHTVLCNADVAYVPLINSNLTDSVPTKIFEAIGCGCPVLLAAVGDSVKIVEDIGLGLSVAPENLKQQEKAIDLLLDGAFSIHDRQNASEYVAANYSRQHEAKRLGVILHEMQTGRN